ncbi:hypothetical protein ACFO5O_05795 [Geojedonia litorea]|uniref:Uncharacterized protein n=1 Tax=Geojedonia litorea TaxID=1268269 RepID=A0ABV9N0J4_9FLAO
MKNKRLLIILLAVPILLLIPFIAMQFSDEVTWSGYDFVVMGALLLITGLLCEMVLRKVTKTNHRLMMCLGILLLFLLVWAELAVGIFGSPIAGS